MANALITPTVIAKTALMLLENELVMGSQVYRDYESEFGAINNGNSRSGDTITIRRPVETQVTDGVTLNIQDVEEGSLTMQVDKRKHIGLAFTQADLTLTIEDFADRYLKDPVRKLANQVDTDLFALYKKLNNWAGTPGQVVNSVADFLVAPQRLDEGAVPSGPRYANMSQNDWYALAGTFSGLFVSNIASDALKQAELPPIGGIKPYSSNNVPVHTVGAYAGTGVVNGASQNSTYANVKTTMTQTLNTKTWTTNKVLKEGDVFTIFGVSEVNPVTKATISSAAGTARAKQFVLTADLTTNTNSTLNTTMTIYPAIITSGPYQNVSAVPADGATITFLGTLSTAYTQNIAFHRNCFALAMVPYTPFEAGSGVLSATQSYKGLSMTYSTAGDITNFRTIKRLDIQYGVKCIDPRLGTRFSGTA